MHATSDWLRAWRRFRPDAPAIYDVGTGRRWTYSQLADDALAWAACLQKEDIGPGDRVAVLAHNRGETFALLFAVAELGAILLPLNWRLSPAEMSWQIDHCGAKLLIADAACAEAAAGVAGGLGLPVRSMEEPPEANRQPVNAPGSALGDTWMLMYTSGSTGRPKGAMITHQQVHWNALNTILACELTTKSSTLTFAPMFHTGGMNCLSTPLLHRGGRIVVVPKLDAAQTLSLIATEGISHLMGVPTIYQLLADHPDFVLTDLSCVRDALCGGAALPLPLLQRYLDRGIPLRQGFGLTEIGPNCFSTPPHEVRRKLGTVGLPIHHIEARIVRPDDTECAPGEPGELLLRGPIVCGGYWDNPEASASSLTDGWFRTGDILSVDEEGYFTVRGRLKEMFISGGENVYPAEVEAAIAEQDGVALVAVVGVPDTRWGEVGCAFIEPTPNTTLSAAAIHAALDGRLARFKRPKQIIILDELPRMGSGKIDKKTLKTMTLED
ncbi:MAG: fatty-acyl-CoA synthase [Myxococcota bacterium]|jgi:fatty-acyl-CoA synthase